MTTSSSYCPQVLTVYMNESLDIELRFLNRLFVFFVLGFDRAQFYMFISMCPGFLPDIWSIRRFRAYLARIGPSRIGSQ